MQYNKFITLLFLILCFCLTACGDDIFPNASIFPDDVQAEFLATQKILQTKDTEQVKAISSEEMLAVDGYDEFLPQVLDYIPTNLSDFEMVYAEKRKSDTTANAYPIYYGVFEYPLKDEYALLELVLAGKTNNCCPLQHIKVKSYKTSPSTMHNFDSPPKTMKRYGFLALIFATMGFILFTAVKAWRDKNLTRKWLWILFILMGTYGLTLNWTTGNIDANFFSIKDGQFNFSFIKFNLLGGGMTRAGVFQPWMFDWGFPLGATVYWFTRGRRLRAVTEKFE